MSGDSCPISSSPNSPRRLTPRPIPFPTDAAQWAKPEPSLARPLPRFARKPSIAFSAYSGPDALLEFDRAAEGRRGVVAHVEDLQVPDVLLAGREVVGQGLRQGEEDDGDSVDHAAVNDLPVGGGRRRDDLVG